MKRISILLIVIAITNFARAESPQVGRVELFCHRTANKDVTENTLESLEQAALLGCNVVEIDLRRTLDGKIILNHDGYLERLTDYTHEGRPIPASRLGWRITPRFVQDFFGRIFNHPHAVLPIEALRPELQSPDEFADAVENVAATHKRVAEHYFADGSVESAIPPLRALLHVMREGSWEGLGGCRRAGSKQDSPK